MSLGQINYETNKLGKHIVEITKLPDVLNIVEVGTWNGLGTTRCVLQGIHESGKTNYNFYSFECNPEMYNQAVENNKNIDPNRVNLIYGKIADETLLDSWFDLTGLTSEQRGWFEQDKEWMKNVPNVVDRLPEHIDFLILDGGEFSTYLEWQTLRNRCKYVALDDTTQLKCKKVRDEILTDKNYRIIEDDVRGSRYGFLIAEYLNYKV